MPGTTVTTEGMDITNTASIADTIEIKGTTTTDLIGIVVINTTAITDRTRDTDITNPTDTTDIAATVTLISSWDFRFPDYSSERAILILHTITDHGATGRKQLKIDVENHTVQ